MFYPKIAQGHPHWPIGIISQLPGRAAMRLRSLGPGRRAPRRCHALWRPTYNCTACPRSGNCKSSVRQKPPVVRAVSIHNIVCPEADIMRHDAEVHARGAAGPMTNVSYFVGAGFRRWRRVNPRTIGGRIGNQIDPSASSLPNSGRNVAQTLRCNGIIRIVSGSISRLGPYI